jgi:hypothetical protein
VFLRRGRLRISVVAVALHIAGSYMSTDATTTSMLRTALKSHCVAHRTTYFVNFFRIELGLRRRSIFRRQMYDSKHKSDPFGLRLRSLRTKTVLTILR